MKGAEKRIVVIVTALWKGSKMATTREDIREWLEEAKKKNATHLVVVCDTFDYGDYPVYVLQNQDVNKVVKGENAASMQRVMEVYNLSMDIEEQLKEHRAWNL